MDLSVPKLKDALFDTKRDSITIGVVIFLVYISVTFVTDTAFGAGERAPNCDQFTWNSECDISGTLHMILGEGVIGAAIGLILALFFHRLTHRNQLKIEQIIESDQTMKNKRKDYAVGHVKNLLSLLFFTLNTLKGSINHYNNAASLHDADRKLGKQSISLSTVRAEEAKVGRILISIRSILVAVNDVLEPELVNRVEGVCNFVGELSIQENSDGTIEFPKIRVSKIKVQYLLEILKTYSVATRSFRGLEQYYESSAFLSKGALSGDASRVVNQEVALNVTS